MAKNKSGDILQIWEQRVRVVLMRIALACDVRLCTVARSGYFQHSPLAGQNPNAVSEVVVKIACKSLGEQVGKVVTSVYVDRVDSPFGNEIA